MQKPRNSIKKPTTSRKTNPHLQQTKHLKQKTQHPVHQVLKSKSQPSFKSDTNPKYLYEPRKQRNSAKNTPKPVFKIYSLCTNVSRHCCESDYRERLLALRSLLLAASDGPLVCGGWGDSFACHLVRWTPAIPRQAGSKQHHRLFCDQTVRFTVSHSYILLCL